MGASKPTLDWFGQPLVLRVAGLLARGVRGPVVVVAPPEVELPAGIVAIRSEQPGVGPLAGIAAGLAALGDVDAVFVVAADTPLLQPRLVVHILGLLRPEDDAAVPVALGFRHPLCAAYRPRVAGQLAGLLAEGVGAAGALPLGVATRWLQEATLAAADPGLGSLSACNTPAELAMLRSVPTPSVLLAGVASRGWTLGEACAYLGLEVPTGSVMVAGVDSQASARLPLAEGDAVALAKTR